MFQNEYLNEYLMESMEEITRLNIKTDCSSVIEQAQWAGVDAGMRIADICCGVGKTTKTLYELAQPAGLAVGIDASETRTQYAEQKYKDSGIDFFCMDVRQDLGDLGTFDFVWVRFVLEYFRSTCFDIVRNISEIFKPGGILCLIDLDYNCLSHYGIPRRLEKTAFSLMKNLETHIDFDPFAGRKLYSHIYRLGYEDIDIKIAAHHLIFGELNQKDAYNWEKKIEAAANKTGFRFDDYENGYEGFIKEFRCFFSDPRRFTYTPLIMCRGVKPGGRR